MASVYKKMSAKERAISKGMERNEAGERGKIRERAKTREKK